MVGYKSFHAKEGETRFRNWHFGIQAKPFFWPFTGFAVKAHVAFTENGILYESKAKQHAARRSQCKMWYNDDWLDRILATMSFLAGENSDEILIPLSGDQKLGVRRIPLLFESPVSFQLMEEQPPVEEPEREDEQDEEIEDEEVEAVNKLIHLPEPTLLFGHGQSVEDPRDGLSLFGPFDPAQTFGVRYGVIGTKTGIRRFVEWVEKIQHPVVEEKPTRLRPPFPGFEAAFGIPFSPKPLVQVEFNEAELMKHVLIGDRFKRTYETAGFFTERILEAIRTEEDKPTLWFIIAPEDVYRYCRPAQSVGKELRIEAEGTMRPSEAHRLQKQPALFGDVERSGSALSIRPGFQKPNQGTTCCHRKFSRKLSVKAHWRTASF